MSFRLRRYLSSNRRVRQRGWLLLTTLQQPSPQQRYTSRAGLRSWQFGEVTAVNKSPTPRRSGFISNTSARCRPRFPFRCRLFSLASSAHSKRRSKAPTPNLRVLFGPCNFSFPGNPPPPDIIAINRLRSRRFLRHPQHSLAQRELAEIRKVSSRVDPVFQAAIDGAESRGPSDL